jgi:uncharacterized protein (TIGR02246 family)
MSPTRTVRALTVMALLVTPLAVRGDELAELRAIFDQDIQFLNARNPEAFVASAHDDVVLFGILSPFAVKGKEAVRQLIQEYLNDHVKISFRPVNPEFFVAGTSALAWGSYSITEYPKVGPREILHGRYTYTYTKANGKWLLAALHLSPITF